MVEIGDKLLPARAALSSVYRGIVAESSQKTVEKRRWKSLCRGMNDFSPMLPWQKIHAKSAMLAAFNDSESKIQYT